MSSSNRSTRSIQQQIFHKVKRQHHTTLDDAIYFRDQIAGLINAIHHDKRPFNWRSPYAHPNYIMSVLASNAERVIRGLVEMDLIIKQKDNLLHRSPRRKRGAK